MYLLLLVSAVRIGQKEQIAWEVLRRGLGESLTVNKITRLAKELSRHGLARVRVTYPPEASGRRRQDVTPMVDFTIFGLQRLTGSRSKSSRREREKGDE